MSEKPRSSNNSLVVSIKNCIMNQRAVFDIYGHLTFENCTFKGIDVHYTQFTFHLHRSKDDFKQIESSPTKPKKVLKMIQCKFYNNVEIFFNIIEFTMNIEIINCDSISTWVIFHIGNNPYVHRGRHKVLLLQM